MDIGNEVNAGCKKHAPSDPESDDSALVCLAPVEYLEGGETEGCSLVFEGTYHLLYFELDELQSPLEVCELGGALDDGAEFGHRGGDVDEEDCDGVLGGVLVGGWGWAGMDLHQLVLQALWYLGGDGDGRVGYDMSPRDRRG